MASCKNTRVPLLHLTDLNEPAGEDGEVERRNKKHSTQAAPLILPSGLSPQTQPSLATPSRVPSDPRARRSTKGDTYRSAWAQDIHTFSCHNMKPPTSTKQKPRGRGKKQGREFVREDVELRHGGGTADRRKHAHTALPRAHGAAAAARPAMGPSQLRRDRPHPPPARAPSPAGPALPSGRARGRARSRCAPPRRTPLPAQALRGPDMAAPPQLPARLRHDHLLLPSRAQTWAFPGRLRETGGTVRHRKRGRWKNRAAPNAPAAPTPPQQPPPHGRGRGAL